jgi:CDP-paratose 2-epimerase
MIMRAVLVTGSSGLIGSEVVTYFHKLGFVVHGIDNNQRAIFFGPQGDTRWSQQRLKETLPNFRHHELDIRDRQGVLDLIKGLRRQSCPEAPFIHMSTNKVYGDLPNTISLKEMETRWDYADPDYANGIAETLSIDRSMHSLFGASKVAADVMVQEYGRYFNMPTCCLRGGCLTGPNHAGVELHGFLSYLVKCNLEGREYTVFGYKGKQVRDNIHSEDVARFIHAFYLAPRCGEVYNLGGGKDNSCSVLEAFTMVAEFTGKQQLHTYSDQNRMGDHICYYSDLTKMKAHFPQWDITKSLKQTMAEIVASWQERQYR